MPDRKTIFRCLLPIAWMALIFTGSTNVLSGENTSRFIIPFLHWLLPEATGHTLYLIHLAIRKCGHLTEYGILCVLVWQAVPERTRHAPSADWLRAGLALMAAVLYAATDEIHQSYVPSRTPALHDVVIDSIGAVLGLALLWAFRSRQARRAVAAE